MDDSSSASVSFAMPTYHTMTMTDEGQVCFVDRLPAETLEAIFIHGACQHYNDAGGHPIPFAVRWVSVSYVSRHWRNVALNCPTLWSYLFITSSRWMEELLARSKQAPLKLKMNLHRHNQLRMLPLLEQVTQHSERIQELRVRIAFSDCQFLSKLLSPAPLLQILEISAECDSSEAFTAPFDGDTPALRELVLMGCAMPWYSLKLSGLTSLSLADVPIQFQQDTLEFLTTLNRMPELNYLYLENAVASATGFLSSAAFHHYQKVNLPHLSRFLIAAPLLTVIALLSYVNIPLKTEVRIYPDSGVEQNMTFLDGYAPLCSLIAQRLAVSEDQTQGNPSISSLIIGTTERGETKLTFSASERDDYHFNGASRLEWGFNIPLQILLPSGQSTAASDLHRIISHFCCPVPLPNVQSLHVLDPPFSPVFWTCVLGRLPDLKHFKLSNGRMPDLASVLSLNPGDSMDDTVGHADRGSNQICVPALEEMELCGIVFSAALEENPDPFELADLPSLCHALSTRTGRRGQLTLTQCAERSCDGSAAEFSLAGRWGCGGFHVID